MPTKTIIVPNLEGISTSCHLPLPFSPSKPTLLLKNSFATTSDLYRPQFANISFSSAVNLLAIEPLGHGQTRTKSEDRTYWDRACMMLLVMQALSV
jgi:pimeloyl-ACP methyl ester carboxylesterase